MKVKRANCWRFISPLSGGEEVGPDIVFVFWSNGELVTGLCRNPLNQKAVGGFNYFVCHCREVSLPTVVSIIDFGAILLREFYISFQSLLMTVTGCALSRGVPGKLE